MVHEVYHRHEAQAMKASAMQAEMLVEVIMHSRTRRAVAMVNRAEMLTHDDLIHRQAVVAAAAEVGHQVDHVQH